MNENLQQNTKKGYGSASLIIGIISLIITPVMGLFIPLVPLIVSVLAIVLGAISVNSQNRKSAIAGIMLGALALSSLAVIFISIKLPFMLVS